tara:strand:- start:6656 stop:6946 length:291 start_codon:yes stop_codon:yes gene_type:complete
MKTIKLDISDLDWKVLEHGDIDPVGWLKNCVRVRVKNISRQVVKEEQDRLIADPNVAMIPATVEEILESHFNQKGYKNGAKKFAAAIRSSNKKTSI